MYKNMAESKEEPRSVRGLLTEMKNTSDWVMDLARASLLFENRELAEKVRELELKMDKLMYEIRTVAVLAARNVEEARKIAGVLQIASAAEALSNSTDDMVDLVLRGMEIHPVVKKAILRCEERISQVTVGEGSALLHKKLEELELPSKIGVRILAVKREKDWSVPPPPDMELREGDLLVARGPEGGISVLQRLSGLRKAQAEGREKPSKLELELAQMYDLSSVMVDLAYSSVLLTSRELAEEVRRLEERFDKLNYQLWLETLKTSREEQDLRRFNSLLQVVKCLEKISDAADTIADVVLRGEELHPVFAEALSRADEQVAKVKVEKGSRLEGKSLGQLNLETSVGVDVMAIERGRRYLFEPEAKRRLKAGDWLVVRGTYRALKRFAEMCKSEKITAPEPGAPPSPAPASEPQVS
ncbi:MAG: TrkA C-terminal domain-containing protein [Candidatus Hadarchaeales archaeon]